MSEKSNLIYQITDAMRTQLIPFPGEAMSVADIERSIEKLNREFHELFAHAKENGGYAEYETEFKRIAEETAALKERKNKLLEMQKSDSPANGRIDEAINALNSGTAILTEWDESIIRQLADTVKVLSKDRIRVYLHGGTEIEQEVDHTRKD